MQAPHSEARTVAIADDALFDEHRAPGYHPERPERLVAARAGVRVAERSGVRTTRLTVHDASGDAIRLAHADAYVDELEKLRGRSAMIDADTFVAPRSVAAAKRAAGAAIAAVDALFDEARPASMALVRPPGHHAVRAGAMGFCLLNNVAIAARWAMKERGVKKIAIVDYDVHHGNGTQDIFYDDASVLYVSTHQVPLYPGTGAVDETGRGDAKGTTINVPLSAEAGDAVYRAAFERVILPALREFAPELVIVSAGFDAHARDPLAAMRLSDAGYAWMTAALAEVARESASGRIALVLEGGYDLAAVEASVAATVHALATSAPERANEAGANDERPSIDPRHEAEIEAARRMTARAFPGV